MTYANQSSNRQTRQKNSIAIFCDLQNVLLITKFASLALQFAESRGTVFCKNIYYNSQHKDQVLSTNKLKELGFRCVNVPDSSKNSADKRLKDDCYEAVAFNPSLNEIILFSGDKDFAVLIAILKAMGKKVIVFAQRGSENSKLINLVGNNNFYFVDELPQLVANINQIQTPNTDIVSQINYNQAVDYLIKAIKTTLSQSKPTLFPHIDKFMRQNCANYQGFSSIYKPNGKKFKSFSQFVDAAVKDGKVQRQGQELFLIELDKLAM
ncbi:MAG: NYN domain-containing protein [Nostoc sp. ChiSLP01]|nr:NYN domain-containing protein [Nostoc sp. CmiSLP01]MDZ8288081.1 NYN domain-containing protein [Nostoc sp. ChiSLP01]